MWTFQVNNEHSPLLMLNRVFSDAEWQKFVWFSNQSSFPRWTRFSMFEFDIHAVGSLKLGPRKAASLLLKKLSMWSLMKDYDALCQASHEVIFWWEVLISIFNRLGMFSLRSPWEVTPMLAVNKAVVITSLVVEQHCVVYKICIANPQILQLISIDARNPG